MDLFIKKTELNIVDLAVSDLSVAAALLRKPRSGVQGLDVRHLTGGAQCAIAGEGTFDRYLGAIDAALARVQGLEAHGYVIRRAVPR